MSSEDQAGNSVTRLPWPEQFEALAEQSKSPILKAFYESGCVSPETPLSEVPFVALDFETTGLDASQHSIVSIGLVPFTLAGIQLGAARHPDRNPSRWQRLLGKKPVSIRLADSRLRYGLPHYAAHNALIDAVATAELLQAQVLHHFSRETRIGDLWL